jgi:choline dehydrogenase
MDSYDFIIVGAGSAGCLLADRLSENGKYTIAVIEAGPSDHYFWTHVPLGYGKTFFDRRINWAYTTEPDPGIGNRTDYWPRGKLLGGSSAINAMVWIRGDQRDYEDWKAAGNPGWGWNDVLPHFKRIEHNAAGANDHRATGGKMHISDLSNRVHPLAARFVKASEQAGLTFNPDFNGPTQEGVGIYQTNTKSGWRVSAARAFLKPAMKRQNVTVLTRAHALRITFEGTCATGIEIHHQGQRKTLTATREVILSAGAVNTPQILQLSGIGDATLLQRHGIEVMHHNPNVGAHLQDHVGINYTYRSRIPTLNQQLNTFPARMRAGINFLLRGRGPLSLSMNQGGGFVRTRPDRDRANIQLYFQAISTHQAKSGTRPLTGPDPFPGFSIGLSNCVTTSRGTIEITSPDPFTHPAIRPNSLATDQDRQDILDGLHLLRRIAAQPAMAEIITEELAPGPTITTDEAMLDDFRARCGTVYHPSCTARMGPDEATSVVDPQLRVHNIKGLRVVDASIFPQLISGNTNAPVMMVASKAADMILADCLTTPPPKA